MSGIPYKAPSDPNLQLAAHDEEVGEQAVKMSLVKMAHGAEGDATPVSSDSPMPITGMVEIDGAVEVHVPGVVEVRDNYLRGAEFQTTTSFTSDNQHHDIYFAQHHGFGRLAFRNSSDAEVTVEFSHVCPFDNSRIEPGGKETLTLAAGEIGSIFYTSTQMLRRVTIQGGWMPTPGGFLELQVYGWR